MYSVSMIFQQEKEFNTFRQEHPELRFWQALLAFSGGDNIYIEKDGVQHDTFYWQDIKIKQPCPASAKE